MGPQPKFRADGYRESDHSGDEQLEQDAVRFMNQLGENGNPVLEKEVHEVLNGEITQEDVSD